MKNTFSKNEVIEELYIVFLNFVASKHGDLKGDFQGFVNLMHEDADEFVSTLLPFARNLKNSVKQLQDVFADQVPCGCDNDAIYLKILAETFFKLGKNVLQEQEKVNSLRKCCQEKFCDKE